MKILLIVLVVHEVDGEVFGSVTGDRGSFAG